MNAVKIGFHFGSLADALLVQVRQFVPRLAKEQVRRIREVQKDADAITRLNIRTVLPDGETRRARQRLTKELVSILERRYEKRRR